MGDRDVTISIDLLQELATDALDARNLSSGFEKCSAHFVWWDCSFYDCCPFCDQAAKDLEAEVHEATLRELLDDCTSHAVGPSPTVTAKAWKAIEFFATPPAEERA